ncbi:MAG TPA: hypothetical protein EYP17_04945 [Candidatus Latescibacteria bacterium]|nr:hypothetical protein [Candidatus Latescibacterota bacterium]
MIKATAPGRAGVIGNPTDMYGGTVISCSTQERATAVVEPWDELLVEVSGHRKALRNREEFDITGDYFDIARAVIDFLEMYDEKLRIACTSDIPFRAGLSGSTAILVAVLAALLEYRGKRPHPYKLAEAARHIELYYVKVVCGYQDAYMCTFGGLNYMDFREKEFYRGIRVEPYATIEPLAPLVQELPVILAHTGMERVSGSVHKPIRERWLEGDPEVVQGYLRMAHLARMGKKAMLEGDWELLGELMNENHEIQRDLGGSGPANERLIEAALDAGAWGAKLAGAGRGGTIIALHPNPEELVEPLKKAGAERILFPKPSPGVQVEEVEG